MIADGRRRNKLRFAGGTRLDGRGKRPRVGGMKTCHRRAGAICVLLFVVALVTGLPSVQAQQPAAETNGTLTAKQKIGDLKAERDKAMEQVRAIVNQPVRRFARAQGMRVGRFPYWFHDGAATPDFKTVDVRKSQEFPYDKWEYVTSDLNPGIVFPSKEMEFNSMTKYFYTDRTLPKKRLTEPEMLEINRLYRVIADCEEQLQPLLNPLPEADSAASPGSGEDPGTNAATGIQGFINAHPLAKPICLYGGIGLLVVVALQLIYRKLAR